MCERVFRVQNLIKIKVRNMLGIKNLEAMLRIALEGPDEGVGDIVNDDVPLWKTNSNYRFLYTNPSSSLNSPNTLSVSDVSCPFGAIDTNINGTQISWLSILTNLWKILGPFVDLVFSKGYILGPTMVGTLPTSTLAHDII
jgi:hypothetical protein